MQIPLTHPHNHQEVLEKQHKIKHVQKQLKEQNPQNNKNKDQNIISHSSSLKQLQEGQDINIQYQPQKLKVYFKQIQRKHKNKQASTISQLAQNSICVGIKTGQVQLANQKHSLDRVMFQSRLKQFKKKQEQQIDKRKIIQMQLKYLDQQISIRRRSKSREAEDDNQFIARSDNNTVILSKKQHKEFLQRIIKQRSELSLRKKHLQQKQKARLEQEDRMKRMEEDQLLQKQKQEKKKKILQKLEQNKVKNQHKNKQDQQNNRKLSQLKQKKFLHQKIQQKYATEVLLPNLQERKKKLRQIRQMSKNFNVQQINHFQKQYLKKKQENLSSSQSKNTKQEWNYKIPQKSHKLAKLLEQESLQVKLKLEQKKRKLQQKIQRQQQFAAYLKERQPPTIDPKKRQQIEQRLRLKSEQKQKPDCKTLGISYLQQVKQQRKKSANSQMQFQKKKIHIQEIQNRQTKKSITNYLPPRKTKQQYEQLRQKRIEQIISSDNKNKSQKIMNLQIEAQRLNEQQKRSEEKSKLIKRKKSGIDKDDDTTNLLLASIKAKMGIIDLYSKS